VESGLCQAWGFILLQAGGAIDRFHCTQKSASADDGL